MNLTELIAKVGVVDVLKAPPSSADSPILTRLRTEPPSNTHETLNLFQALSNLYTNPMASEQQGAESMSGSCEEESSSDNEEVGTAQEISNSDSDSNSETNSESESQASSSDDESSNYKERKGRRSNDALKHDALMRPFFDIASSLAIPCNSTCCFKKSCTNLKINKVLEARTSFFGATCEPAPTDKEKAAKIVEVLNTTTHKDDKGNLIFNIDKNQLCTAGYARVIGLSNSPDISEAPGQFRRLINEHLNGKSSLEMLATAKIKLDKNQKYTVMKGFIEAFITGLAKYYSDSLPSTKSERALTEAKQLPYRFINDMFDELVFQCETAATPIPSSVYGSLTLFKRVFKKMQRAGKVQLVGGKSGFDTCAFCNHCLALKKSAAAKRDRQLIDIVRALQRIHLNQQHLERQHCENFIYDCKHMYNELGEPIYFFVKLDGMSLFKTLAPKLLKEHSHQIPQMENRLIGARIVCGPIDTYIAICTSDLIPGGANVMIEATRIAIETLAKKLAANHIPFALPDKGGFNYDNCGENKV